MRLLLAALVALLAAPSAWAAGEATITHEDLPIGAARRTAGAVAPVRFDLVGLHWQGSGSVLFRTRDLAGRWSAWRRAAPEDEDQPDRGTAEAKRRAGWRIGNPYWVGPSDRIGWKLVGDVRRLRAWYVWSPVTHSALRTVSMAGSPKILPRSSWKANDEILRGRPRYASKIAFAVVHHTAGTNSYTAAQSPAIVRGIELYHVEGNGWNDIGYNFLVDKYGQVFEGRAGGIERNVIGAHAEGFNTGSTGVALIGNYNTASVSSAAENALVSLLAWRLDVAHVDPLSTVSWASGGNPKYPRGRLVRLRAISGHRDTGFTSCPGTKLYARLPTVAQRVAALGLPKLYTPVVTGGVGGQIHFSARLSSSLAWTVTVRNAAGAVVALGRGTGTAVAWTWNATHATGSYTWTMEAGPDVRPATGAIGKAPPPPPPPLPPPPPPVTSFLSGLTVVPPVTSPDGDGIDDTLTVSYVLTERASVTATVKDATGTVVATLFSNQTEGAKTQSFPYGPAALADGAYTFGVSAVGEDGRSASLSAPFSVDRTLSGLALTTSTLTPNGDGVDDTIGIGFTLAAPANVAVQIEQGGVVAATVFAGGLPAGSSQVFWDGGVAPSGSYEVDVLVDGPYGRTRHVAAFTLSR
jgi:hypothetical protein